MAPFRVARFSLARADADDADWLARTLTRHGEPFGTRVETRRAAALFW